MVSDREGLVFIMFGFGVFFVFAVFAVKSFRYKYGAIPIPWLAGRILCGLLSMFCFWVAMVLALKP
jgi:hypothetical protein